MEPVGIFFKNATFSDGTTINFGEEDILVFVGPNNTGKSLALSDLSHLFQDPRQKGRAVISVALSQRGSEEDLLNWLEDISYIYRQPGGHVFVTENHGGIATQNVHYRWSHPEMGPQDLSPFFRRHLGTSNRLELAKPPENISLTSSPPTHPIHFLQRDDGIEKRVCAFFRQAFGMDLIVHHNSGKDVPLYCGTRPPLHVGEDRVSARYLRELEQLPKLHEQGDGLRSFVGVLLHSIIGHHSVVLIDEPEAFLHPPQARLLGKMLTKESPRDRQLLIATHSADVLKGLLDGNKGSLRVIRLTRDININRVCELQTADVEKLWGDPLLRHSDVLSGLFHEKVVVCESDSDCRFYAAILDALIDDGVVQQRDVMFVHCGGKGRIPTVVKALSAVGVPVSVVADFDILNDENPLRPIYESLGGDWNQIAADWRIVKNSIEAKKPELNAGEVRREIETLLAKVEDGMFPKQTSKKIQEILRRSSPWATAKAVGKTIVPSGEPTIACSKLFKSFANRGLLVVEVGELEGFAKSTGGHGPQWVNEVLPKVLKRDSELESARHFVKRLVT